MMYEIMTIIPSRISDTEIDTAIATIAKLVENAGGKVEKTQNLGKMKLAYPIEHQRHGTYVLVYADIAAEVMPKLDQNLRLTEEVIRHLIIARPNGIPTADFKLVSYTVPLTPEGRRASERDDRPVKPSSEALADKALSTVEIEGKLDAILDSDIMKNI